MFRKNTNIDITTCGRVLHSRFDDRIPQVRRLFSERIASGEGQKIYPADIDKTLSNDYWVRKFLVWCDGNVKATVDKLLTSLITQRSLQLREVRDNFFPAECWLGGSTFFYEPDRLGRPVLYIRLKFSPRCRETRDYTKTFAAFTFFKGDEMSDEKGYVVVYDCQGASLSNVDMDVLSFVMSLKDVFPNSVALMIAVNMPFFIRTLWNAVKFALPKEQRDVMRVLSSPAELEQFISSQNIPDFLGGSCRLPYSGIEVVPPGCPSLEVFARLQAVLNVRRQKKVTKKVELSRQTASSDSNNNGDEGGEKLLDSSSSPRMSITSSCHRMASSSTEDEGTDTLLPRTTTSSSPSSSLESQVSLLSSGVISNQTSEMEKEEESFEKLIESYKGPCIITTNTPSKINNGDDDDNEAVVDEESLQKIVKYYQELLFQERKNPSL